MSRRVVLLVLAGALVLVLVAMTRDPVSPSVPGCPWDPTCATAFEGEATGG